MMERRQDYEVQNCFVVEVWHGWKYRIYNWRAVRNLAQNKIKGTVKPEKLEFNEAVARTL